MKNLLSIALSSIWILISEFIRNQFLFKDYWSAHYSSLGLIFKTSALNGIIWLIWSILLAILIFILLKKFSTKETMLLSWFSSFVMIWLAIYNLQVLPMKILLVAIPLSLLEIIIATIIIKHLSKLPAHKHSTS